MPKLPEPERARRVAKRTATLARNQAARDRRALQLLDDLASLDQLVDQELERMQGQIWQNGSESLAAEFAELSALISRWRDMYAAFALQRHGS